MAVKKTEKIDETDALALAAYIKAVSDKLIKADPRRSALSLLDMSLLADRYRVEGLSADAAADRLIKDLVWARDAMLKMCTWHAHVQGWQTGTELSRQGSQLCGWFTDMVRLVNLRAFAGESDLIIRLCVDATDGKSYPLALPAARAYLEYFNDHADSLLDRFQNTYLGA